MAFMDKEGKKETLEIYSRVDGRLLYESEVDTSTQAKDRHRWATVLEKAISEGVDLSGAELDGLNLVGADLRNGIFRNADFGRSNFHGANLSHGDFSGSNFAGAYFHMAIAKEAKLRNTEMCYADLRMADFELADMRNANLEEVNAHGTFFGGADLINTILDGARVDGANFKGAFFGFVGNENIGRGDLTHADIGRGCLDAKGNVFTAGREIGKDGPYTKEQIESRWPQKLEATQLREIWELTDEEIDSIGRDDVLSKAKEDVRNLGILVEHGKYEMTPREYEDRHEKLTDSMVVSSLENIAYKQAVLAELKLDPLPDEERELMVLEIAKCELAEMAEDRSKRSPETDLSQKSNSKKEMALDR